MRNLIILIAAIISVNISYAKWHTIHKSNTLTGADTIAKKVIENIKKKYRNAKIKYKLETIKTNCIFGLMCDTKVENIIYQIDIGNCNKTIKFKIINNPPKGDEIRKEIKIIKKEIEECLK